MVQYTERIPKDPQHQAVEHGAIVTNAIANDKAKFFVVASSIPRLGITDLEVAANDHA